jgi:hypothetical protein
VTRVSAPINPRTLRFLLEHAVDLGLPENASQASVIARAVDLGAQSLARAVRDAERDRLYAEWADDDERREAAVFLEEVAAETGAY